ncbi:MAG: hypothetical protein WCE20_03375 [Rhizomicrobium sp.]
MPTNDIEVFDYLLSDSDTPAEIDYLTYAVFAYKKKAWCDHFEKTKGHKPTHDEIDEWIGQLSDYEFRQIRNEAAEFFHAAAEEHLADYIEQQKEEAVDNSILSEVEEFTDPWRHAFIALGMAIVAPIVLGLAIFLVSLFDSGFPVHVTFGKEHAPITQPAAAASTPSIPVKSGAPQPHE